MCSKCENCELLVRLDEKKIRWYKSLVLKNFELHGQLTDQQELIATLKNKLFEKRSSILCGYISDLMEHTRELTQNNVVHKDLENQIKTKLEEVNRLLAIFNSEKELFQQEVKETESYFSNHLYYLQGLVDYFRESLFDELEQSNKLKQYFLQKIVTLQSSSHSIILETLKEESRRLNHELRLRYHKTIQKSKEEIEKQNVLVAKLRRHNRQLYLLIHKTKIEHQQKIANLEKNLHNLWDTTKRLKEKNVYLRTQVKLEVEGCQNDIYDARKAIRKLKTLM